MKKWIYLVIGLALIVNAIFASLIALQVGDMGIVLFQGIGWGTVGVVLLYKAVRLFIKGRGVSEDAR